MYISEPYRWTVAVCAAVLLACGAILFHRSATHPRKALPLVIEGEDQPDSPETLTVHVSGQVQNPGLYKLPAGSRVDDAVRAAGGLTAKADRNALNLAAFLVDGQQIFAPALEPQPATAPARRSAGSSARRPAKPSEAWLRKHKVNINSATSAQLQNLPGIGPATAEKILRYRREHGSFATIEELVDVPGIGPKTLERLRDLITV